VGLPQSGNRAQIGLSFTRGSTMAGPGRPGRQSAAAAGFPAPSSAPAQGPLRTPLRPPAYLPDDAREMFGAIVINSRTNHFVAADVPMLAAYCEAHIQARDCAKQVRGGKVATASSKRRELRYRRSFSFPCG
jgi:phage terminase small subunit